MSWLFFFIGSTDGTMMCGTISSIGAILFLFVFREVRIDPNKSEKTYKKEINAYSDFLKQLEKKVIINNYKTDHIIRVENDI